MPKPMPGEGHDEWMKRCMAGDGMDESKCEAMWEQESMSESTELLIYAEIGPAVFGMVDDIMVIDALNKMQGAKKISIRLNSPGGDAFMGVSIMNAFKRHQAKIIVHVDALAASAASIIAMGGDKLIMHEGSMLMIHRAWTIGMGNSEDMAKISETLDKVDKNLIDIYHRKSGLDKDKIKKMIDAETWLQANEARDLGFADSTDTKPTGAVARVPHGWYSRTPDRVGRYAIATCARPALAVATKQPDPDIVARRERLQRLKQSLKVA